MQRLLIGASGDPIGTIVTLEGVVKAIESEGGERVLKKGASIFLEELIQVGSDGKAQLKFTDGGVMNLISGSEFRVDSYRYRQSGQKDQFSANLLKGGFRSLSGSIAKKNAQEYQIQTPSATIGLRGTIIEVSIVGFSVYFGVSEGRAIISNPSGSQMIGVGEKGQFVLVPSAGAPPQLISRRPSELDIKLFIPAQGGINIDRQSTGQMGKIAPSPQEQAPQIKPEAGTTPPPPASESAPAAKEEAAPPPTTGPTIGETKDQSEFQFTPKGGGGAIQGGC